MYRRKGSKMRLLSRLLLIFYLLIIVLWVMNSQYLFSIWGVTVWLFIILLGFVVYKQLNVSYTLKNLVRISNYIMLLLVALTAAIFYTISSMS
jgi:hypothetical protein